MVKCRSHGRMWTWWQGFWVQVRAHALVLYCIPLSMWHSSCHFHKLCTFVYTSNNYPPCLWAIFVYYLKCHKHISFLQMEFIKYNNSVFF
jgi:hypothetical protein